MKADRKRPVELRYRPEPLEYEGNLVDGIIYNKRLFPPTWSLDDEGFEVSSFPDYKCLDIIRPVHEVWGGTPDDYTSAIQPPFEVEDLMVSEREMERSRRRKWAVRMSFITAVHYITAVTGHKHEPLEMIRVNILYPPPRPIREDHFYLTFTARNLSTGLSQTFQAALSCIYLLDPIYWVYYIRLKPKNA
ncbi:hypothetical protein Tsubulata_024136, partial [Turnera subulata]